MTTTTTIRVNVQQAKSIIEELQHAIWIAKVDKKAWVAWTDYGGIAHFDKKDSEGLVFTPTNSRFHDQDRIEVIIEVSD